MDLFKNEETFTPDNLFAGNEISAIVKGVELAPNQTGYYARGSVLMASIDGIAELLDVSKLASTFTVEGTIAKETKGSTIIGILSDDIVVPTEGTDITKASAYICGYFNSESLICASGTVSADVEKELRELGFFIK